MAEQVNTMEASIDTYLRKAIEKGIEDRITELYAERSRKILEQIEREKAAVIAGVLVDIMKMADFEVLKDRIVFTIKTKK